MNASKWISTILCGSLVVFSPGLGCYAALAGGFEAETGAMDAVGAINMPVNASVGESLPNLNVENLGASGVNLPAGNLRPTDLIQDAMKQAPAADAVAPFAASAEAIEPSAPAAAASAAEAIAVQAVPAAAKMPSSGLKGMLGAAARRVSALAGIVTSAKIPGGVQGLSAQIAQGRVEFDLAAKTAEASPVTAEIGAIKGTGAALGKPGSGDKQDDALTAANLPGTYAVDVIRQGESHKGRITFNENYTFTAEDGAGKSAQGDWTLELGKLYLRRAYLSESGPAGTEIKIDVAGMTKSRLEKNGTALYMTLVSLATSQIPKNYWVIAKEQSLSTDAVPAPTRSAKAANFLKSLPDKILDIGVPFGRKSWKKRLIPIAAMVATAVGAAFVPRLFPIIGFTMLVMSGIGMTAILPGVAGSKNKTGEYLANLAGMVLLVSLELTLAAGAGVVLGALAHTALAAHAVVALAPKAVAVASAHPLLSAIAPVFGWSLIGGALATVAGGIVFGTVGHFVNKATPRKLWGLGSAIQARGSILSMVAGTFAGAFFGAFHPAAHMAVAAHAASALLPKAVAVASAHPLLSAIAPVFGWSLIGGALATIVGGIVFGTVGHFMKSNPTRHNPWGLGITVQARGAVLSMVAGALAGAFFGAFHPAALPTIMAALAAHMTSARAALSAGRLALWLLGGFVVSDLGAVAAQRVIEGKQALLTGRPASPRREALLDAVNSVLFYGVPVAAVTLAGLLAGGIPAAVTMAIGSGFGLLIGHYLSQSPHAGPAIQYALILGGVYLGALWAAHSLLFL